MANHYLRELKEAKKTLGSGLIKKSFALPHFTLQQTYQNYSKAIHQIFEALYQDLGIDHHIQRLLSGEIVNSSEKRAALHHQYRNPLAKASGFDSPKAAQYLSAHVKRNAYQNIFIFGIGGSYEGPKLLHEFTQNTTPTYFITGPDKSEFTQLVTPRLSEKNLYIFASKSFATDETLLTLSWLPKQAAKEHCIAITANKEAALAKGFLRDNILLFPETIGGRYSIWSPISAPVLNPTQIHQFLQGARSIDTALQKKTKVMQALKSTVFYDLWAHTFLKKSNRVVLSYNWPLRSLATYLQQLEMESLGKPANTNSIFKKTGQIIYGGFGSTAQHSYFQLLHQGTTDTVADIVHAPTNHSKLLNAQAQGQAALLSGQIVFQQGQDATNSNIPVNFFQLEKLNLASLGALIAFWEYRVFISASMLGINPFDQFGVNAGKKVAQQILQS
jgi:glucose-6-phosphate isomerase